MFFFRIKSACDSMAYHQPGSRMVMCCISKISILTTPLLPAIIKSDNVAYSKFYGEWLWELSIIRISDLT